MSKVTPFLMFNDELEAAMEFYAATFPDSEIGNVARAGQDGPVRSAAFVVGGQKFMGYNGGPHFSFSEGFSLFVTIAATRSAKRRSWISFAAGARESVGSATVTATVTLTVTKGISGRYP